MTFDPQALIDEIGPARDFRPWACYNPDGDCIEFYFSNEPFYAKRVDGWVTTFNREDGDEIIGGAIKGVKSSLLERFPGVRIFIDGSIVKLTVILSGPALEAKDELIQKTYRDVMDKASTFELSIDDLQPC